MSALSVVSLSGEPISRISGGSLTTLAEVRAEVERSLPEFRPYIHDIKLCQGERELADDAAVAGEVQAVLTKSEVKVIGTIMKFLSLQDCAPNCLADEGTLSTALVALDEMGELSPESNAKMWESIREISHNLRGRLTAIKKFVNIVAVFGRACGDPSTYMDPLEFAEARETIMQICQEVLVEHRHFHTQYQLEAKKQALQVLASLSVKMHLDAYPVDAYPVAADLVDAFLENLQHARNHEELSYDHFRESEMEKELIKDSTSVLKQLRSQKEDVSVPAVQD